MQLVLVAPGLLALPAHELAAARALRTLARHAAAPRIEPNGIAPAMLTSLAIARDAPVAPLAMLGAGGDPGDDYVLCADPVHLAADRDTVVLVQRIIDLSEDAVAALMGTLAAHFAGDDLRFEAPRPDAWFARCRDAARIDTTPIDATVRRSLLPRLPRGADAGRWKRWQNEIEMLLHEHPANHAREARGEPAVNGIWFWGGGRLADVGALPMTAVTAAPSAAGDLARGIALRAHGDAATLRSDDDAVAALARATMSDARASPATAALVVLPPARDDVHAVAEGWLAPALELLTRHRIERLQLIADGHGAAVTWDAQPPTFARRVTTWFARARLEIPQAGQ